MTILYDRLTDLVRRLYDSQIHDPPVLDMNQRFPAAARLEEAWPLIREEALTLAQEIGHVPRFHELMAEQADISANDNRDWRMFVVKAYGVTIKANQARCPTLASLVADMPDVLSATLSFLAPRKHIPPHRGPFRGVLRFYMGLSVPTTPDGKPATVLTVDGVGHPIGDGECLLWDDTFTHEVWNHSDSLRIALLLDVSRRGLPPGLALLSRLIVAVAGTGVWLRRGSFALR